MPLELLSSIKGASSSEAVSELFNVIKKAVPNDDEGEPLFESGIDKVVSVDSLRGDVPEKCPDSEKQLIRQNFPKEKKGYLVVPKVIED